MGSIRGFSWNCGGLRRSTASTTSKVMFFEKSFKNSFDFFFFLETHHEDENDIPNELMRYEDTYDIVHSPRDENNTYTGIIGLIRKEYKVTDIEQTIQGRILSLKLTDTTEETTYRFSVVYFPTNNKFELEYYAEHRAKTKIV